MKKLLILISTLLIAVLSYSKEIRLNGLDYVKVCSASQLAHSGVIMGGESGFYFERLTEKDENIQIWLGETKEQAVQSLEELERRSQKKSNVSYVSFKDLNGNYLSLVYDEDFDCLTISSPQAIGKAYLFPNKKFWEKLRNTIETTIFVK